MAGVPSGDVTLQKPIQDGFPIISPLCGYDVGEGTAGDPNYQTPVFYPYSSSTDPWWDNLVAELLQAGVTNVSFATRGTYTTSPGDLEGPGNMNPRRLYQFVDAINRAGVASQFKVACFLDAPAVEQVYTSVYGLPANTLEDMADNTTLTINSVNYTVANHWQQVWWLRVIKPWFDTVPRSMWFTENGHPRIEVWGLGTKTTNGEGNCSGMINYISSQMSATYGVTPVFVGGKGGGAPDTTWLVDSLVIGGNPWFAPPQTPYRFLDPKNSGYKSGTVVAGYAGTMLRNVWNGTGANGDTLRGALAGDLADNCHFAILEGWSNVIESMGLYRSTASPWDYPNQYINILRPYMDLRTVTTKLEAEGCDEYSDTTTGNSGGSFLRAGENLDVRAFTGTRVITASSTLNPDYVPSNGMDGVFRTKWISHAALPQWLQCDYGAGRAGVANTYYVTSADNAQPRDPSAWTFQGSNDGTTWTTLDTRTGELFAARKQTNTYAVTNTTAYRYYRLNVTAAAGGPTTDIQIADFRIVGSTITGAGWAVTDTAAGEWLGFYGLYFSTGTYKFPIRYSSSAPHTVRLSVDGVALPDVVLPSTGSMSTFDTAYLGTKALGFGIHNLQITFVDGGIDVDWVFAKKIDPMVSFKSAFNNCFLTTELGGNVSLVANRTAESIWERFSVNGTSGGLGTLSNGTIATIQGYIGYYLTAAGNGGGNLTNGSRIPGTPENFTLVKISGSAGTTIATGDLVALKSSDGAHYVTVAGSNTVNATGTSIGTAQTFTVKLSTQ